MLDLIVACDLNFGIGANNDLLTHLKDDLMFFKATTKNRTIIMGRKTFESLPGKLPNRKHVVVTRDPEYKKDDPDIFVYTSLEDAVKDNVDAIIIGGGEIYKQSLEKGLVKTIYLTLILNRFDNADTFFPQIPNDFKLVESHPFSKNQYNKENFIINTFVKS